MPSKPPHDDLDRDAFYGRSINVPDDDEGEEYELEPPDDSVITAEQGRTEEIIASVEQMVDIDELMREQEKRLDYDLIDQWIREFRFQFRIKHLLIATAVIALLMAVTTYQWQAGLLATVVTVVGGLLYFLTQKERHHQAQLRERRRQQADRRKSAIVHGSSEAVPELVEPPSSFKRELSSFFSPWELLFAIGISLASLGVLLAMFGLGVMATCLSMVALAGFLLQVVGVDLPRLVALVWWVLLVCYVVLSLVLLFSG